MKRIHAFILSLLGIGVIGWIGYGITQMGQALEDNPAWEFSAFVWLFSGLATIALIALTIGSLYGFYWALREDD